MKLLFDQNLPPKLVNRLADLFPDSSHVQSIRLDCASDDQIWEHVRLNGFAIVTKDEVEAAFRARFADIEAFEKDLSVGTLVLS